MARKDMGNLFLASSFRLGRHFRAKNIMFGTLLCLGFLTLISAQRIRYCDMVNSGEATVTFLSDNEGTFTDGAVDTGMGVYMKNSMCKWVLKPSINEEAS